MHLIFQNFFQKNLLEYALINFKDSERSIISSSPTTSIYSAMYRLIEQLRKFGLNNIHFDDISKHSEFIALRKALDTGIPSDLSIFHSI